MCSEEQVDIDEMSKKIAQHILNAPVCATPASDELASETRAKMQAKWDKVNRALAKYDNSEYLDALERLVAEAEDIGLIIEMSGSRSWCLICGASGSDERITHRAECEYADLLRLREVVQYKSPRQKAGGGGE